MTGMAILNGLLLALVAGMCGMNAYVYFRSWRNVPESNKRDRNVCLTAFILAILMGIGALYGIWHTYRNVEMAGQRFGVGHFRDHLGDRYGVQGTRVTRLFSAFAFAVTLCGLIADTLYLDYVIEGNTNSSTKDTTCLGTISIPETKSELTIVILSYCFNSLMMGGFGLKFAISILRTLIIDQDAQDHPRSDHFV